MLLNTVEIKQKVNGDAHGAQTVRRAVELLRVLVQSPRPLGATELSRLAGVDRAATYRLLKALELESFVTREPSGPRFVAGTGLIALSAIVMSRIGILEAARPAMVRIAGLTSETVTLHVRHLRDRICLAVIEDSTHPVRRVVPLGTAWPLYRASAGKVILTYLPEEEQASILAWAEKKGEDLSRLRAQIESIRRQGYAVLVGDYTPGVGALSVPIFDSRGVAAALTISGPAERWTPEAMEAVAPLAIRHCQALSNSLGHLGVL